MRTVISRTPPPIRVGHISHGNGGKRDVRLRPAICESCEQRFMSGPNGPLRRHCDDCRDEYEAEKRRAHNAVNRAIRYGKQHPPTDYQCRDCDADAVVYDHRDYRKPLEVDPVCKRCNKLRLGALWSRSAPLSIEPLPAVLARDCAAITLMVDA